MRSSGSTPASPSHTLGTLDGTGPGGGVSIGAVFLGQAWLLQSPGPEVSMVSLEQWLRPPGLWELCEEPRTHDLSIPPPCSAPLGNRIILLDAPMSGLLTFGVGTGAQSGVLKPCCRADEEGPRTGWLVCLGQSHLGLDGTVRCWGRGRAWDMESVRPSSLVGSITSSLCTLGHVSSPACKPQFCYL